MGISQNRSIRPVLCSLLAAFTVAFSASAYQVNIGNATAQPGGSFLVPVMLDNAADVAVVKFQINYDPQLLTLAGVTNRSGTLGSAFALNYGNDDGVVVVILYRQNSLVSGSGELVSLQFTANSGAELNMESALTLAEAGLGNQKGKDLSWNSPVAVVNGLVQILSSETADSDGDGIPDQWESRYSQGSTNMVAGMDEDGDGLNNLQEYIAGLNPTNFDGFAVSSFTAPKGGSSHPEIHWNSASGRVYSVYWTSNLMTGFTLLQSNIHWSSGGFTDQVHNAESRGYYKIKVQIQP